ncbi:MAG: hypothetical protein M9894_07725 [Planctomycetes bacterium]|nr:hypothetical protein [Planctomycetota bacterium]
MIQPQGRRRASPSLATYALPAAAILVVGGGGLLWLGGAFGGKEKSGPRPLVQPPGTIAVPLATRPIKAYSKVSRDDLWDAKNGRLAFTFLKPENVPEGMVTDVKRILLRVVGRDKAPGYAFNEEDFLPEGTRPGVVGGIPPGRRALRVKAESVAGLIGLRHGDRFDLVSTVPVDLSKVGGRAATPPVGGVYGRVLGQQLAIAARAGGTKHAHVTVVVQNGVVVSPVETRAVPTTTSSLTQGPRTQTKPVQELVIAILPEEVAPLTEALAIGAVITCLPRSGHPDDPADSSTPGLSLDLDQIPGLSTRSAPLAIVDHIDGERRALLAVPEGGEPAGE